MFGSTINFSKVECFANDIRTLSALCNNSGTPEQRGSWRTGPETISVGNVLMQTTLQLNAKDRVYIKLDGTFSSLNNRVFTFFEGRLISVFDE